LWCSSSVSIITTTTAIIITTTAATTPPMVYSPSLGRATAPPRQYAPTTLPPFKTHTLFRARLCCFGAQFFTFGAQVGRLNLLVEGEDEALHMQVMCDV